MQSEQIIREGGNQRHRGDLTRQRKAEERWRESEKDRGMREREMKKGKKIQVRYRKD